MVTPDGKIIGFQFVSTGMFINGYYITAFTSTIAVLTTFFDKYRSEHADQEIVDPKDEADTDKGDGSGDVIVPDGSGTVDKPDVPDVEIKPDEGTGDSEAGEDNGNNNMGDPNKNPDPTVIAGLIAQISNSLKDKVGTCDEFAKALVQKLNQSRISFEIIRIDSKAGYIYSDKYGNFIGKTYHYGIRIGNIVYDNLTLTGMRCEDWINDLGANGEFVDMSWKIVKEIINH